MGYDLFQPEYLFRLARSGSPEDRQNLAHAVLGILHTGLEAGERAMAEEILLHLLKEAETDMRMALADRLAQEATCPQALLDYLVYENSFEIAESVLQFSDALTEEYLVEVVQHFEDSRYWQCIARRRRLGQNLTRYLIGTNDRDVYRILVKNRGADFCPASIEWMVQTALANSELQAPLISRPEVTPELAAKLYWHVSSELRFQITSRFDIDARQIDSLLSQLVKSRLANRRQAVSARPANDPVITPDIMAQAMAMRDGGGITSHELLDSLQKDHIALFFALWGCLLGCDPLLVAGKIRQDPARHLAVICCAAEIPARQYNVLFLLWRRYDRAMQPGMDLAAALEFYHSLTREQALGEIRQWQDQDPHEEKQRTLH